MYGLDRAFEAVGFSNGGATERLAEVDALIAAGAVADGLRHASAVLDGRLGTDGAMAALSEAAERFEKAAISPGSQAAQIGYLIEYLQKAVASDAGVDAHAVAEMVRDLGRSGADPAGPPVDPGSHTDPAGPPEQGSKEESPPLLNSLSDQSNECMCAADGGGRRLWFLWTLSLRVSGDDRESASIRVVRLGLRHAPIAWPDSRPGGPGFGVCRLRWCRADV